MSKGLKRFTVVGVLAIVAALVSLPLILKYQEEEQKKEQKKEQTVHRIRCESTQIAYDAVTKKLEDPYYESNEGSKAGNELRKEQYVYSTGLKERGC